MHNKTVFKQQLASRVVDKKNPVAWAKKNAGELLFEPRFVPQQDLSAFNGMDPHVLDKILATQDISPIIRSIYTTDTFERNDEDVLTAEEQREVQQLLSDEKLKRSDLHAWNAKQALERQSEINRFERLSAMQLKYAPLSGTGGQLPRSNVNPQALNPVPPLVNNIPLNSFTGSASGPSLPTPKPQDRSLLKPTASASSLQYLPIFPPGKGTRDLSPILGASTNVRAETPLATSRIAFPSEPRGGVPPNDTLGSGPSSEDNSKVHHIEWANDRLAESLMKGSRQSSQDCRSKDNIDEKAKNLRRCITKRFKGTKGRTAIFYQINNLLSEDQDLCDQILMGKLTADVFVDDYSAGNVQYPTSIIKLSTTSNDETPTSLTKESVSVEELPVELLNPPNAGKPVSLLGKSDNVQSPQSPISTVHTQSSGGQSNESLFPKLLDQFRALTGYFSSTPPED